MNSSCGWAKASLCRCAALRDPDSHPATNTVLAMQSEPSQATIVDGRVGLWVCLIIGPD
ncbi:MAG: hypothetical protein KF838_03495 [Phycisphaeraceae bacterium]|nr:MAG: hypothetical protein KF838_03495 [Phycisphaeraceae bacterium]